jgi:hypothetical protein
MKLALAFPRADRPTARHTATRARGLLALVALLIGLSAGGASASMGWCRSDPVVMIDGQVADVFISAPLDAPLKVTGPTEVVITVPVGVDAALIASDLGFGSGEVVRFRESRRLRDLGDRVQVKVAVRVPAVDDEMPVRVEFAPRIVGILSPDQAEGTANRWITLKTET